MGWVRLKQKLKLIKTCLKDWHQQHFQNMDGRMMEIKNKMSHLDVKAEMSALSDDEVDELHELFVNLHSMAQVQNSVNWQKSRMNLLQEGDANTKFFHGCMSNRRRHNAINTVFVDGVSVEGVHNIRAAAFNHFSSHFKHIGTARPSVDGLMFRKLS